MALISCKDVSLGYEGSVVVEDINFEINRGDYLCIVGENGSGKSTLIKGLLNLKKPLKGEIILGDDLKPNEIGYLPQQTAIQKNFPASVYEVVLSGRINQMRLRFFYGKDDKAAAEEKMELMGISELKNRSYQELSGGQQQRVLLARALCATKKLLLLDEPSSGLDPVVTSEFCKLIKRINNEQDITIVMVSHDVHTTARYASHVLHLGKSQLFFGKTRDYLESDIGKKFTACVHTLNNYRLNTSV